MDQALFSNGSKTKKKNVTELLKKNWPLKNKVVKMHNFLMERKEVNKEIKILRRVMMKCLKKTSTIINWLTKILLYMKVEDQVDLEAMEVMLDHK